MAFFEESFTSVLNWCLISLVLSASCILSVMLQHKGAEKRMEHKRISSSWKPREKLHHLNYEISSKSAQLRVSMNKIREIRDTISEMEYKSERIQSKYKGLLLQLKTELAKTEWESKALCSQINKMTSIKLKAETEFLPKQKPLKIRASNVLQCINAHVRKAA